MSATVFIRFVFVAERIDRRFHSNHLFIRAVILSVCFLKTFVSMCQVSRSNTAVVCVDSARWRLPRCSTISCSAGSSSAPCTFLIQRLWVGSWPASPETWMRVRLDLSWLWTFPPRELSVSEVTLVDKVYCQRHSVVSHGVSSSLSFAWHVDLVRCCFFRWLVLFQSEIFL